MQINRLFEIIYILLDKKNVTSRELAERFEVSQRTIYRDIDALSLAGIPIYMNRGKGGGISILPEFVLNKAVLTDEDKVEILSSLKAVNSVNLSDSNTDVVFKKLSNVLGGINTDWIEVDFTTWGNADEEREIFNITKNAILNKKTILFNYVSGKGENISREVYPLKLCFKGQSWYLYAYCKIRSDYRFFKLKRIKDINTLCQSFNMKAPAQVFSKESIFNEEYIKLKLKIPKSMAFRVYDEFRSFRQLEDGNFIAEIEYPIGPWIFNYVFSFGEECEVLEPEEIRVEIKNKFQRILKNYY